MTDPRIELVIIDPQIDFMDLPGSQLPVPGASNDMRRLAAFVSRCGQKLSGIHVTMDSHHLMHIANPMMWVNGSGEEPAPFTTIKAEDIADSTWRPNPRLPQEDQLWCRSYVQRLAERGRSPLTIWPPHCLIGSAGHAVEPTLYRALLDWEESEFSMVHYILKGSNYRTEHYSAVEADVPDPADPATSLNRSLLDLQQADIILVAGEARSHCVANTLRDLADYFDAANIGKLHLLEDCTSDVSGCERMGADFVDEMKSRGMKLVDSVSFQS
jgi:nicotinamidase-related amidase